METQAHAHQVAKRPEITPRGYVLIVGSGTEFLEFYSRVLRKMGFTPLPVVKCEAALAYLRLLIFDFVLLDQGSWKKAGQALLNDTRKLPNETPLLVVARRHDLAFRAEVLDLGVWDCLLEPISNPELESVIYALPYRQQYGAPAQQAAQRSGDRCFRA